MGATSSFRSLRSTDASIELDNAHIYHPGEIVSGTLHLNRRGAKNEPVSIDLIGEFGFTVLHDSVYYQGAVTNEYHMRLFKVSVLSIRDGENFALSLDEQLPLSINLVIGIYPYIRYFLQVNMSKSEQHRHYIIVCPRVPIPRSVVQSEDFAAANRKEMHLSGTMDRDWVLPGETVHITFQIKNPHNKHIRFINGNIFMEGEFKEANYHEKVMDFHVKNISDTCEEHITGAASLTIPSRYLPPTFNYINDQHKLHINISYWIIIEMHVRGLFNTISTTIPISIGFEPENIIFDEQYNPEHHHGINSRQRSS